MAAHERRAPRRGVRYAVAAVLALATPAIALGAAPRQEKTMWLRCRVPVSALELRRGTVQLSCDLDVAGPAGAPATPVGKAAPPRAEREATVDPFGGDAHAAAKAEPLEDPFAPAPALEDPFEGEQRANGASEARAAELDDPFGEADAEIEDPFAPESRAPAGDAKSAGTELADPFR